jgi:hypothetical protein
LVFRDNADEAGALVVEGTTPGTEAPASMQGVDFGLLDGHLYPHLVAAGVRPDRDDGFEFALDTLLDGLEVRLRRHGAHRPCADS